MPKIRSNKISGKATEFINSRKNANNLVDILELLEKKDESTLRTCIVDLEHIFLSAIERKDMVHIPKETAAETAYRSWLQGLYGNAFTKLVGLFMKNTSLRQHILDILMNFIACEERNPLENEKNLNDSDGSFPVYRLKEIVGTLLSYNQSTTTQIKAYLLGVKKYEDVLFFTWQLLLGSNYTKNAGSNEIFVKNFLCLFDNMLINYKNGPETKLCQGTTSFTVDNALIPKKIEQTWLFMMQWHLTPEMHKQMMELLLIKVIPHMKNPLWYTDYLVAMLNAGGALSVLALQGMLTLIQKFNMDYPLAYEKLYLMMNQEIFQLKYKQRLFYMADLFLSSSHLPQTLVASFIKRMARLTLVAPPHDIQILLAFIGNLLIRHNGLKKLLVGSHQDPELTSDPFDMNEPDPTKTKAIESFLWEVHSLKQHYLPGISNSVKELTEKPLPAVEWDLSQLLDNTQDVIFERELKKKQQEIMLNYDKPQTMQLPQGERLLQYWTLS